MKRRKSKNKSSIILLNDDFNTFEHVIQSLREICGHNYIQATQCASIVHSNGKCEVFRDKKELTEQIFYELELLGLTVELTE
jgi:ATP-dependent Clp protease adaptor protein ClpS